MNRFLVCAALILCLQSVSAVDLENLCQTDVFQYKNFQVNSAHRVMANVTLKNVGLYLIDEDLDFTNWSNDTAIVDELENIKLGYNRRIIEVYSEEYINSQRFASVNNTIDQINEFKKQVLDLKGKLNKSYLVNTDQLISAFDAGISLIKELVLYADCSIKPSIMSYRSFKILLNELKIEDANETLVFQNDMFADVYKRQLFKLEKFTFNKASNRYYSPLSNGTITWSISLPFRNKHYKVQPDCLKRTQLPTFFTRRVNRF